MAEEDLISSLYPPPPKFYEYFTAENLEKLRLLESEGRDSSLEGELKLLVPPSPPLGMHYRGYGNIWSFEDRLPTLKTAQWQQLYEDDDEHITSTSKIAELHKLVDSLLLNFLEALGVLSIDPQHSESKIKDITLILVNMNHLLNTYRPHQSRELLILLLRSQISAVRAQIADIDRTTTAVSERINALSQDLVDVNSSSTSDDIMMDVDSSEQRRMALLAELLSST